jgi:hypothetical protein
MKDIVQFIFVCMWVAGVVIAEGFWSTFCAIIIPFWSFYLVIERIMEKYF